MPKGDIHQNNKSLNENEKGNIGINKSNKYEITFLRKSV